MTSGNGRIITDPVYYDNIHLMIDWTKITGFDWDVGNEHKSVQRHSVSRAESEQVFFNEPLLVALDARHSLQEKRYHALGRTDDARLLHITFTLRAEDTLIRPISARDIARKERTVYEEAIKGSS